MEGDPSSHAEDDHTPVEQGLLARFEAIPQRVPALDRRVFSRSHTAMETIVFIGLAIAGGWILGVVGFFRAIAAHTELRVLRRDLTEALSSLRTAPAGPDIPWRQPETVAAAPPVEAELVAPAVVADPPPPVKPALDLETLITARWGVWLGSAALLFAGVFLIRYAVEQSLLGPGARCALAGLLGLVLVAGAEFLFRAEPVRGSLAWRDQAPAGLAAGGVAILFGAAYGAGPFYDFLPPLLAFAAMALPCFLGLAAALRYGPLTAATGIVGAFATPALVSAQDPSLPGLFLYLIAVSAASWAVVRYTAWVWLGWATTAAGAAWICLAAAQGGPDVWAAAVFLTAAAALGVFLLPPAALDHPLARRLAWVPLAVLGGAGLVSQVSAVGLAPKLAVFALAPLVVARVAREPRLDRLPWLTALLGLLTLLVWAVPAWREGRGQVSGGGVLEALLPGAWAPDVVRPLLAAACLFAAFHAAAGLWFERRAPRPLVWAALVAAVPLLTLGVVYAQIAQFQTSVGWAGAALALAAGLTVSAGLAVQAGVGVQTGAGAEAAPRRAGVHAAGGFAALALACAIMLNDQWLTLAIALYLPVLAWIEAKADLRPLRAVALGVAGLVMIRLVLNWYVLDYAFGMRPVVNGLFAAYAAPALSFAVAAVMFRRRGDDRLVAVLQAGAITLAALFVALELRHGTGGGRLIGALEFGEVALHVSTIGVQACVYLYFSSRSATRLLFDWAWRVLGMLALGLGFLLVLGNPAVTGASADAVDLIAAYLLPAGLAVFAYRLVRDGTMRLVLGAYALVAGFVWITVQIRMVFHPSALSMISGPVDDAELWAWSGGWLMYGIGLMVVGIRWPDRTVRLVALAVVGLVCAKVFLVDMSGLTGLWRVLSFLGLGLALIGLGVVHRRFVAPLRAVEG